MPDRAAPVAPPLPDELVEANIQKQRVEAVLPAVLARGLIRDPKVTTTIQAPLAGIVSSKDLEALIGGYVDRFTPNFQKAIVAQGYRFEDGDLSVEPCGIMVDARGVPCISIPLAWTGHAHGERIPWPVTPPKPKIVADD